MFPFKRKTRIPNNPRRILVVGQANLASTTGGSITAFFHFCRLMAKMGYEVTGTCYGDDPRRPALLDERVRFVNLRLFYKDTSAYHRAFNRLVGEWNPDLIVFFFPHYCLEVRPKSRFKEIPRLIMFHSRPDYLFAQLKNFPERLRRYYTNTHSQVLLDSYRDLLPEYIRKGPVHVIANGIKPFPETINYRTEHKRIVYFSRIDRLKGLDLLIDAMVLVKEKHPDWRVDVYGDIEPETYGQELQKAIDENQLRQQIRLMGRSDRSTEDTLKEYDFCVFPSRLEGFSIGLGESLSIGLACIGLWSCSGVNEVIVDGYNGLLCQDEPEDFARAVNRLIEHPQEREKMGKNARLWMRQYHPTIIDMQWMRLIHSLLKDENFSVTNPKKLLGIARATGK